MSVYTCFQNHVIHAFRAIRGTCCHFVFRLISLVHKTECPFISYFLFLIVQSIFDNFILCFLLFSLFFLLNIHIFFPGSALSFSLFLFQFFIYLFFVFLFPIFLFSFSLFLFLFLYTVFILPFFFISYSFLLFSKYLFLLTF